MAAITWNRTLRNTIMKWYCLHNMFEGIVRAGEGTSAVSSHDMYQKIETISNV